MTRDEETYFLRLMQIADKDTLNQHFTLHERTEKDDIVELHYSVTYGHDNGTLDIRYRLAPRELMMAEMNVGFQTMIGLNRSPLELRILADHIIDTLDLHQ